MKELNYLDITKTGQGHIKVPSANGEYGAFTAGSALQVLSGNSLSDKVPYIFRPSASGKGITEKDTLVGASVAWNQLCNGSSVTVPNGHKYYLSKGGTKSIGASNGSAITGLTSGTDMVVDLTLALGSTIADYIYTIESGTEGAGVAKLREWGFFTKPYYAYNAGSIESVNVSSHKMVGLNIFDEAWVSGSFDANGELIANANWSASEHFMPVVGGGNYFVNIDGISSSANAYVFYYDGAQKYIDKSTSLTANTVVALPANCAYIKVQYKQKIANVVNYPVCINISNPVINGTYEPYTVYEYPLPTGDLRGVLKLDANNNLYAYGDIRHPDKPTDRLFGIVDLGAENWGYTAPTETRPIAQFYRLVEGGSTAQSLNLISTAGYTPSNIPIMGRNVDKTICLYNGRVYVCDSAYSDAASFKTAMNGVYLVYELATPTTETADPFQSPQICSPYGTEEYVDAGVEAGTRDVSVPVGHETEYPQPVAMLPDAPSGNGNYKLRCTVSGGVPTYSWVSE